MAKSLGKTHSEKIKGKGEGGGIGLGGQIASSTLINRHEFKQTSGDSAE